MGNKMTLEEKIKANKRMINRAIRDLERERANLEREEKRLELDIKKLAQKGQMGAVRVAAKDLVRTKKHIEKFHQMTSTLKGLNLKITTMKTSNEITQAMGKMSKAMKQMSQQMNVPKMQEMMMEFQKQEQQMEATQEVMDDVIDDVLNDGDMESEDDVVNKVLAEIGVEVTASLKEAPLQEPNAGAENNAEVSDLEARLENLRRE